MDIKVTNLSHVKLLAHEIDISNKIKLVVANVQSLKPKEEEVLDYFVSVNVDIGVLTETWLQTSDSNNAWVSCSSLNNSNFCLSVSNRVRRGGGLAIVHKINLKCRVLCAGEIHSFWYAEWSVKVPGSNLIIIGIYHPPYSAKNPFTNVMFIDDLTKWLPHQLIDAKNVVLARDFNIHVNKLDLDDDAHTFIDTLEALGFKFYQSDNTHKSGNILTQEGSTYQVLEYKCGPYLPDHKVVECVTSIVHGQVSKLEVSYGKPKTIDIDKFIQDFNLDDINATDLDKLVNHFHKILSNSLDLNAPIKTKLATIHHRVPWFTEEICEQKRVVRGHEKLRRKYSTNSLWKAFKVEKSRY